MSVDVSGGIEMVGRPTGTVGDRGLARTARSLSPAVAFIGAALLGVLFALAAAGWVRHRNDRVASERFEAAASRLVGRIQDRLTHYEYGLRGVRGVVAAMGVANLTEDAFRRYAASRDLAQEFPGSRGFGFIQRVKPAEEAEFLRVNRAEVSGFAVRELAPNPAERFVIRYVQPVARNRAAVGLDVASEPARRAAAMRAVETGATAMTGPITLVQAPGDVEHGFLVFLPIFAPDLPAASPDERRDAAVGWAYAPIVIDEVLTGLDLDADDLEFSIEDRTPDGAIPFYATPVNRLGSGMATVRLTTMFDRTWVVTVRARPAFLRDFDRPAPAAVAGALLVLGLLAAGLSSLAIQGRRREILAAVQRNRLAAIVENADEAILGKTLDGTVTDWNPAAERLFGYTASEAVGRKAVDLIFPPHLRQEERETLDAIGRGEAVCPRSTMRMRRDGTMVHVLVGVSPIRASVGTLVGAASLMRDIGERVANEERIKALNKSLEHQVAERTEALREAAAVRSAILQHAAYAIIATDPDGLVTVFNPAAERMLGYSASEVVGRATSMLFHDPAQVAERARRFSDELGEPIAPGPATFLAPSRLGQPPIDEWTYLTKDGKRLPVLVSISEMRSETGVGLGYLGIAMDLTERHQHAAEMRAAKAGTWSYDIARGRVRLSAECARQHGLPDVETELDVETEWRPLAHPDDVNHVLADLTAAIATHASYTTEFRVLLPGGGQRWLTAIGRVEPAPGDRPGRVIGLTLDVTARKDAELALVEARREAERANRAKGEFLAAMSHEIRTPLNAILGYTRLMLDAGRLPPREHWQAELVRSAGAALLTVVNDILDFSKVEAGAITLSPRPFSPTALARNCVSIIEGLAMEKGLAVHLRADAALPASVLGDEERIRQVLLNLLNNAVKFTWSGTVTLCVEYQGSEGGGERLGFAVTDSGIGIPPNKRDQLFKRFSQVDGSVEREYGGTGLGLAICKALVDLMGGQIGVESTEGVGSTFRFDLVLPEAEAGRSAEVPARCPAGPTSRILLVEDNLINQKLARTVLELAGHTVAVVSGGAQAVRAAAGGGYELILMDVQMPGMDGLSATRAIRVLPGKASSVPIIGMSAGVLPMQVRACREAGMDDHVGKPFDADTLLATIAGWLPAPGYETGSAVAFDEGVMAALAARVDRARLRQVLALLEAELAAAFAHPVDGPEGRDRARIDAHSLGSAAGMVGFAAVTETCRTLDTFDERRVQAEGTSEFDAALCRAKTEAHHALAVLRTRLQGEASTG